MLLIIFASINTRKSGCYKSEIFAILYVVYSYVMTIVLPLSGSKPFRR